ncbi:uncharacterized protein LOC135084996 isoform X1 [Ostrinia nubilalis]|uniref:uncharacterized protein LOC135084996 isoform X1 n=1 Tax=Ostrinia nubilalis TaxID=29057 RepID=UPI0030824BD8
MFTDEEDESSLGAVRYPCMPSLVALQQMRNRLHLAYLGRKLMKWTALATGRELRRIAMEMHSIYDSFAEDLGNAFMLLARGRYFYPNLNKMVLENCPAKASVVVGGRGRMITGVKVMRYEIVESGFEPYEHLGIEKGGQQIHEAKLAWLELLKRMILMQELRNSFMLVEEAHKNATKRLNAIRKIVVPRTQVTIHYILLELEEMGREELFRIKLVKKWKARLNKEKEQGKKEICPICNKEITPEEMKKHKEESQTKIKTRTESAPKVIVIEPVPKAIPPVTPPLPPKPVPTPPQAEPKTPPQPCLQPPCIAVELPQKLESIKEIYRPPSARAVVELDNLTRVLSVGRPAEDNRLDYLKKLLAEIIGIGREMVESGVNNIDMDEFLRVCEEAKGKIDNFFSEEEQTSQVDPNLQNRLQHLKLHLREVIDLTQDFRNETMLTTSVEHFIETCEEVDEKLDVYMKNVESKPISGETKARLETLKQHIKDVVDMTEDYKLQGLLTPSVEDFIKTCRSVQSKIDTYSKEPDKNLDVERLNHLKDHVGQLEKLTTDIKEEGMVSSSLEKFLLSCKDFKTKLDDYKKRAKLPPRATFGDINKLVEQIDETMDLSELAKDEGLISESVDEFIRCCENMKKQLEIKDEEPKPQTLGELRTNIDGVIKLIQNLKAEGLITESVEDFLKTCESTKGKIDVYDRYPFTEPEIKKTSMPCSANCTCGDDKEEPMDEDEVCENCEKMMKEPLKPVLPYAIEPCDSCRGLVKYEAEEEYPCDNCSQVIEPNLCTHCKQTKGEEECPSIECPLHPIEPLPPPPEPKPPSPVDSSLGYFEKKIKKITRVTRTLNDDGTIREETETIIIRKNRHDPNETGLMDDDDDDEGDTASFEDIPDENDENCCALCLTLNQNQLGFRRSKSEETIKLPSMAEPNLRQCISIDMNMFKDDSFPGLDFSDEVFDSLKSVEEVSFKN